MVVVDERDWPFQACQTDPCGPVYLNCRGTYGIGSAAYWWGRLAAALRRWGRRRHAWVSCKDVSSGTPQCKVS